MSWGFHTWRRAGARALAVVAVMAAGGAWAAPAAAQTAGQADATILAPVQLQRRDDLEFGALVPGATGGAVTMNVSNLSVAGGGIPILGGAIPITIGNGGVLNIHVGGRLNVGANQPTGGYQGTFSITVNYL